MAMEQQRIGRYHILEEIASGAQGTVYRAFDPISGEIVALKVLHPGLTRDRDYLERFGREASLAASINHPNVVKIFEVGEDDGRHFMALEFLPESLARVMGTAGSLSADRAATFAAQIADGLEAAHALGIVHRDIKPQNVLIGPDGTAKVTDFGIARGEALATMTATGAIVGTPHYMSPEQARGERADARSDLYSLGCILYQMLTGELPFTGDTPHAVLRQHIDESPEPVRQLQQDIPAGLADVVERAMRKTPVRRYQRASGMAAAIRAALPEVISFRPQTESARSDFTPPPPTPPPPAPRPPDGNGRSPSWLVLTLAVLALAGIGIAIAAIVLSTGGDSGFAAAPIATSRPAPTVTATRAIVAAATAEPIAVASPTAAATADTVRVVHWTTGHLTRDGLLKEMAEKFNNVGHSTGSGKRIVVEVYDAPSELQGKYLSELLRFGTRRDLNKETNGYVVKDIPDPTIVTPSSAHWLVTTNYEVGRPVVDLDAAESIVRPVIGIVTYEEMAKCMGWPQKKIGFADIIALRNDPEG
jgi:serine/threonine protein kinase